MQNKPDLIIGIDAGTSVIKAVAFDLNGRQIAMASIANRYTTEIDGSATQCMDDTWEHCVKALKQLSDKVESISTRTVALSVTGQGDGTWLIDKHATPVTDAWLWLDSRSSITVERLKLSSLEADRFFATGTGLNSCQQGSQLAHMLHHYPTLINTAAHAFHCKDWLYYQLTDVIATDPSEASFTFGDFRNREYSDVAVESLGLSQKKSLLPPIVDGVKTLHTLTAKAASLTGLQQGTPVCLGYVDMIMTALGGGVYTQTPNSACSAMGTTGVHMRAMPADAVVLPEQQTGYVLCIPEDNIVALTQTNMATTLNIDWLLDMAAELLAQFGQNPTRSALLECLENWVMSSTPGSLLFHPYISNAGERGPFMNSNAQASFLGLTQDHKFADLARGVFEGLSMAARDCYAAMGDMPSEVRVSGGAARSAELRKILSASLNAQIRFSDREEAGAAGCAMMAAVAIGAQPNMDECIAKWVTPYFSDAQEPDAKLVAIYDDLFCGYQRARVDLERSWEQLSTFKK